jgi:hypothetical protein
MQNQYIKTQTDNFKKIFISEFSIKKSKIELSLLKSIKKNKIANKKIVLVGLFFLSIGLCVGFGRISTYRLLQDEVYELARANGNTLHPISKAYKFKLRDEIIPAQDFIELQKKDYQKINILQDIVNYGMNFYKYTNHPPLNSIIAKFFICKKSSIANLRKFGFAAFLFLLFATYFFVSSLRFSTQVKWTSLAILTNMSLINSLSHFGKGYSLSFAFMLLAMGFYNKYLVSNKNSSWLISFVLFHLAMLTHYFTGTLGLIMLGVFHLNYRKSIKSFMKFMIFGLSLVFYIPLFTGQVVDSNSYFDNHQGINEILLCVGNLFQMISFNYRQTLDLLIGSLVIFIFYLGLREKPCQETLILLACSLIPFLFFLGIDFLMNKHLSMVIRYELFAFVFFGILLAKVLENQKFIFTLLILSLLILNLTNHSLQKHWGTLNSFTPSINQAMKLDLNKLEKRTLFIGNYMYGEDLTFMNHLFSRILNIHPLDEINPKLSKSNTKIQNIFFASRYIKKESLKALIKQNKIEKIIFLD